MYKLAVHSWEMSVPHSPDQKLLWTLLENILNNFLLLCSTLGWESTIRILNCSQSTSGIKALHKLATAEGHQACFQILSSTDQRATDANFYSQHGRNLQPEQMGGI